MPRRRSSAHRSGSIPVSARTSVDLPWSTCPAVAITCMPRTAAASASSASGGSARRSSRQRPRSRRPSTAGSPARSAAAKDSGSATAALGSVTPGAPPPPTVASASTASAGMPRRRRDSASRVARACSADGRGVEALPDGRGRAAQGGLHRGEGQLVHAQRAGERVPAQARDQLGAGTGGAEQQPGLRAAEQLVAGRGHERGAAGQRRRRVRLVGQQGVRGEQAGADVGDDRHAERQSARPQLVDVDGVGEAGDHEVRGVDLEHERGVRADGVGVVGGR